MAPKTAVSLPRKLNNSYAYNLTAFQGVNPALIANSKNKQNRIQSQAMNLNVTQNSKNAAAPTYANDEATLKRQINFMNIHQPQTFLPFTGVDQPFMMSRPQFSRVSPLIPEKLNDVAHQNLQSALNMASAQAINQLQFKNAKGKLVYDSTYLQNFEMTDQDCRLYVPSVFRKQNGAHINEKPSKYFKHIPKQQIERERDTSVWSTNTLVFESRFESGNLGRAYQITETVYDLELRSDFGSVNPLLTQWFYFRIKNTRANTEYTFNITNLFKPDSSYAQGMKPLVYSEKQKQIKGQGWYRDGYEIRYFATQHRVKKVGSDQQSYTLSFKIKFPADNDTIYLSHCFPYTYSDLVRFLNENCNIFSMKDRLKRTQMCRTIAGNSVEMLIITNLESSQDDIAERGAIIVSSRVHPGESNASFIVEGFIQFMMSNDEDAVLLRDRFVFKIIPMLNPDGVIVGNYRSSLGGYDLNRQWQNPSMKVSPEIYCMKEMIKKTLECRKIDLFVDIHGHSRQKNLFIYGCSKLQGGPHTQSTLPYPGSLKKDKLGDLVKNLQSNGNAANTPIFSGIAMQNLTTKEKVFPWLFHKNCENFSYHNCLFGVHKSKESTGRAVVWREFGIVNSYTLECSFCGPTQGMLRDCHFTIESLIEMGVVFGRTILEFSNQKLQKVCQNQIESFYKQGGGYIYHGFNGHEKRTKKSEKELQKKMKKIDGNNVLSRQKTPLLKQHSMISPHPNGGGAAAMAGGQMLQMNGIASQHHQVQSVMNKQKKSVQLETISAKKGEDNIAMRLNVNTADGRKQLPLEKVRESSVHVILKQHSKSNLIDNEKSKERVRDRSHKQSTTQRVTIKESNSVRIKTSEDGREIQTENDNAEKATFQELTPKQNHQFKSNLTSMQLVLSENDPNLSDHPSNQSPKTDMLIKKFHSQHDSKKLKLNKLQQRLQKESENGERIEEIQVALPNDSASQQPDTKQIKTDSQKNLLTESPSRVTPNAPQNDDPDAKELQAAHQQTRVTLKSSIHHYSRKQNTLTADNRNAPSVAQDDTSQSRKLANSEHQYFNNGQNKKNIHGINMSALSKLRVSLAQNVNVAEQILTRDFKKSGVTENNHERNANAFVNSDAHMLQSGKSTEQQSRNLKSGVSSKKGTKKDKKNNNQKMLKMGEQFSGKKLSTKSSLHLQQQPQLHGQMTQHQQTNQVLSTHSQLMKTAGFQNKKSQIGTQSTTFKDHRTQMENRRTDDDRDRLFTKGIIAVGSEKHLKYNNLKKQLQKQKEERLQSNKSSALVNTAGGGSTIGTGKRQNREPVIIDQQFSNAIDELLNGDQVKLKKSQAAANDYSPLYKDYQKSHADYGSAGKKQKKSLSQMKDYTSEAEGKKETPAPLLVKQTETLTSFDDFAAVSKKKMNQNNLSPQPTAQTQNKRLRAQKQQLLLLSDKKGTSAVAGTASRGVHESSPYKSKRNKAQSSDKFSNLEDNSRMQDESAPQRPGHSELTFTSLNESNNRLIFHKSIDLKQKSQPTAAVPITTTTGRIQGQSQHL